MHTYTQTFLILNFLVYLLFNFQNKGWHCISEWPRACSVASLKLAVFFLLQYYRHGQHA